MIPTSIDKLQTEIDQEHGPLLLFFEQRGVPACRWTSHHVEGILKDLPVLKLIRVDAALHPDLCLRFKAPRAPHLCFVLAGKPQAGLTGVYTPVYLRQWLEAQLQLRE